MSDEELMLALSEVLEKLEIVETAAEDDYLLLRAAMATIDEVRTELRYGLGEA